MEKFTEAQIKAGLATLPEWAETGGAIQRTYRFKNFVESMKFVDQTADAAEDAQHHPDILVRYNKVTLTLSTHDAGGLTEKDFVLAGQCDKFAEALGVPSVPAEGTGAEGAAGGTGA